MRRIISWSVVITMMLTVVGIVLPTLPAYACQTYTCTSAPPTSGGGGTTSGTTTSGTTVTTSTGSGTGTVSSTGGQSGSGSPGSTVTSTAGGGYDLNTPGSPAPTGQPTATCVSGCNPGLAPPTGPDCWWSEVASVTTNGLWLSSWKWFCINVPQPCSLSICTTPEWSLTCPPGTQFSSTPILPIFGGPTTPLSTPTTGVCQGIPTPPSSHSGGWRIAWVVGVPGQQRSICVTGWQIEFQGITYPPIGNGQNCFSSFPPISVRYRCGSPAPSPTYKIYATVGVSGGGSFIVSGTYSKGGFSYTLPYTSFPKTFLVSSGVMTLPGAEKGSLTCPSGWNSPPTNYNVTVKVPQSQHGILSGGATPTIQALGEPIHIEYVPTIYNGHFCNANSTSSSGGGVGCNTHGIGAACYSLTTNEYYNPGGGPDLWVTGGDQFPYNQVISQTATNGKLYHLIDGLSVLPYNASITGDGSGTWHGQPTCQATLRIHGPTPPNAPYIVQAIPQFTYTYGIVYIHLTTTFANILQVTNTTLISTNSISPPCPTPKKNKSKCPPPVTGHINFTSVAQGSTVVTFSETTHLHTVTLHTSQPNVTRFNAVRPYIKSQSY